MRVLVVALIVSGCALREAGPAGPDTAASPCETGTVGAVGPDPFPETVLHPETGRTLALEGEVVERLTQLARPTYSVTTRVRSSRRRSRLAPESSRSRVPPRDCHLALEARGSLRCSGSA